MYHFEHRCYRPADHIRTFSRTLTVVESRAKDGKDIPIAKLYSLVRTNK